ncbi:MAG: hypothetical protein RL660_1887 [Bacteroidota bacterium]|jgi:hypothetical protein
MKFQVGDPIIVLKTKEEGRVIDILDKGMLAVMVGGVTFPIFSEEVDHPYLYWFLDKNKKATLTKTSHGIETAPRQIKAKTEDYSRTQYPRGLKLIFVPVYKNNAFDDVIEKTKIYLSNNLDQRFSFNYFFESRDGERFEINSELMPYQDFYVHDVHYEQLATNPYFEIRGSEIVDDIVSTISNFQESIYIKPKKLLAILNNMHEQNHAYFDFTLIHVETLKTEVPVRPHYPKLDKPATKKPVSKKAVAPEPKTAEEELIEQVLPYEPDWDDLFVSEFEVDLHIEKIHPNHQLLGAADKLEFQLLAVRQVLEIARQKQLNTLILIHGNGKGVLKQRIFSVLDQTSWVHSYVNKDDKRYGLGATEIFLGY